MRSVLAVYIVVFVSRAPDLPEGFICEEYYLYFRSINGGCENYPYGLSGVKGQRFSRYVPQKNDTDALRKSVSGRDLPNPRVISTTVHTAHNFTSNVINNFFAFFGLFVAHDMEKTVVPSSSGCCKQRSQKPCLPISIPSNDTFYGKFGVRCLEYARSCKRERDKARSEYTPGRAQFNNSTVFLDLSQIYGSDVDTAKKLRNFGQLKTSVASDGQLLLPTVEQAGMGGSVKGTFAAGDSRVNMFPQLTAIYTLFVLEHNRLAEELRATFPVGSQHQVYDQARRILIGIYQYIIYNEYLPLLIGNLVWEPGTQRFFDDSVYPEIINENVVAGNLHMYSTISGTMEYGKQKVPLRQTFFNSSYLQAPSGLLRVIQGMSAPAQDFDRFVTAELTNHFLQQNQQYGVDAVAMALQRGRDHASATYVETVRRCTYEKVNLKNFDDILEHGLMEPSNVEILKQVYSDVRDIDLFTGGFNEKPIPGAILGQTLACLQQRQFRTLAASDYFFYSYRQSFNAKQYFEIRAVSMQQLICRNVKGYSDKVLRYPLKLPSDTNKPTVCSQLHKLDVNLFREFERHWLGPSV